jgi:hypothetical protein
VRLDREAVTYTLPNDQQSNAESNYGFYVYAHHPDPEVNKQITKVYGPNWATEFAYMPPCNIEINLKGRHLFLALKRTQYLTKEDAEIVFANYKLKPKLYMEIMKPLTIPSVPSLRLSQSPPP